MQVNDQPLSRSRFEESVALQKLVIEVLHRRGEPTSEAVRFLERLQEALELSQLRGRH
jgi:hypothetical protein